MKHISAFDCSFRALDGEVKRKKKKKKRLVIQTQRITSIKNKDRLIITAHCEKSIDFPEGARTST